MRLERPHPPAILFFGASLVVFCFLATYSYDPATRTWKNQTGVFSGDEPHYLVVVSSLLSDGDLSLANNYARTRHGGPDAGRAYRNADLDHHTLIRDTRSGETMWWHEVFDWTRAAPGGGYARLSGRFADYPGPHYTEAPNHPLPFPLVIAAILKLAGTDLDDVEPRAIYANVAIAWLTGMVAYGCGLQAGLTRGGALGAVALLFFSSPWLAYSHGFYPAALMGLLLTGALWAFLCQRLILSVLLIAVAAVQSEAFVLLIPAWAIVLHTRGRKKDARLFAIAGAASMIVLMLISQAMSGKSPTRSMEFVLTLQDAVVGETSQASEEHAFVWPTFLAPDTGIWLFVPWSLAVMAFLLYGRDRPRITLAAGIFPLAAVYMALPYTGQFCYGPRYWVPFLPWLAIALVVGVKELKFEARTASMVVMALVILGCIIALTAAVLPPLAIWGEPPWAGARLLFLSSGLVP